MGLHRVVASTPEGVLPLPRPALAGTSGDALRALAPMLGARDPFRELGTNATGALVRDLAFATAELATTARQRVTVPTEARGPSWEIGLERDADDLLVSVYRAGAQPEVAQTAQPVSLSRAARALLRAIDQLSHSTEPVVSDPMEGPASARGLALARQQLLRVQHESTRHEPAERPLVRIRGTSRSRLSLGAELRLRRVRAGSADPSELARSDLHALLFSGDLEVGAGQSAFRLQDVHVVLVAEQLVALAHEMMDARQEQRVAFRRVRAGVATCGLRLEADGKTSLVLAASAESATLRLPPLPLADVVGAIASFALQLVKGVTRVDRTQASNLRLGSLRAEARRLSGRSQRSARARSQLNLAPESYQAFAESTPLPRPVSESRQGLGKLRFAESWRAAVGGIDLRAVFLLGDVLVVGSSHEIACIERSRGDLVWRRPSARAVSIMTPRGLARLRPDGALTIHGIESGEVTLRLHLDPFAGASASGAVVNVPGLPRMLLVGAGAGHLVAIDLDSGEIRWRRSIRHRGLLRLRRAGKLVVVAGGESEVFALDLLTGEIVWRHCGPSSYPWGAILDRGELFVLASAAADHGHAARLERIDPWSGEVQWSSPLPRAIEPLGGPRLGDDTALLASQDDGRLGLLAFDRATGELRFDRPGALGIGHGAWIVVDDLVIANGEDGALVGVSASDGALRYRRMLTSNGLSCVGYTDRPNSYQPVLRSGALFVPQGEVFVVRPRDGEVLGNIPCDLVPDLLRVDERCGVYVAEVSGHLAAYAALPTLQLLSAVTDE